MENPIHTPDDTPQQVTFREALRVWTKIGLLSFGGPAGQHGWGEDRTPAG